MPEITRTGQKIVNAVLGQKTGICEDRGLGREIPHFHTG